MLIGRDDVRTQLAEQPGDRRDDAMPVWTGDEDSGVIGQPPVRVIDHGTSVRTVSFSPVRYSAVAAIVVVSPHFDDAVLSCWSIIDGEREVVVVTVFTAAPRPGVITDWDRDTGVDSATRVAQRVEENRAALDTAGRQGVNLGLLELQYGGGRVSKSLLRDHLRDADLVYVPAGAGVANFSLEHERVRKACLKIRRDARLYADQPYCQFRPDFELSPKVAGGRVPFAVTLSAEQRARKERALRCYAGEMPKLERLYTPFLNGDRLAYELFWDFPPPSGVAAATVAGGG